MIYWIWMTQIPQVGPVLSNRLLEKFKTPVEIYRADHEALQLVKGISNRQIEGILCSRSLDKSKEISHWCQALLNFYIHAVKSEFRQFSRPLRGIGAIHFGYR